MRIPRKARNAFCLRSTGQARGAYYPTKGHAVCAFDATLQEHGFYLHRSDCMDFSGDEGRKTLIVCDENGAEVGYAIITWYRMPSGRYEFVGYIA